MFSEKILQEIKEYENAGISVVATDRDGKIVYSTKDEYCDHCSAFRLQPDPDPYDWFRDNDVRAVCLEVNGVIVGSLETPSEYTNIRKPLYCPKLGRELSEDEKKEAAKRLEWAKERMKRG